MATYSDSSSGRSQGQSGDMSPAARVASVNGFCIQVLRGSLFQFAGGSQRGAACRPTLDERTLERKGQGLDIRRHRRRPALGQTFLAPSLLKLLRPVSKRDIVASAL